MILLYSPSSGSMCSLSSMYWLHGSPKELNRFDVNAVAINRTGNVSGIYLTQAEPVAVQHATGYGKHSGFIHTVQVSGLKTFVDKRTKVTEAMAAEYRRLLLKHYHYTEDWLDAAIIPDFLETGKFKDVSGDIKREVYEAGGFNSFLFQDMFAPSLVVFDPAKAQIIDVKPIEKE